MDARSNGGSKPKTVRDKLSQWDTKLAPLSESQKSGVMELSTAAAFRPLPSQLPVGEEPVGGGRAPSELRNGREDRDKLSRLGKLENSQQFLAWFDEVETQMQAEQEKCYQDYSSQLQVYQGQCASMLSEVDQALHFLQEMRHKHKFVSQKTGALHQACEQLVAEQTKLVHTAESISSKLSYFTELERVGTRLGGSTLSVTSDSFIATLARLDDCISFIEQNPHYKESAIYLVRFRQYLSRALGLVKQHVVTTLKTTTRAVQPKQGSPEVLSENSYAQYYGKFRSSAPKIKNLMKEIEQRASKASEYQTLLQDCHQCYVQQRGLLLTPTVSATIEELKKNHSSDHCGLVRSGCNFLSRVCQDEYQLFFHFFSGHSAQLNALLESLCYSLYDTLRPVIIHTNHLETLADLCTIFKVEMLEERVEPKGSELAAFGAVVKQMLEDVQQRLVFRAQRYVQTDIRGYSPVAGDLAYPDKLLVANQAAMAAATAAQDLEEGGGGGEFDSVFDTSGAETEGEAATPTGPPKSPRAGKKKQKPQAAVDMHAMWYPTVRRTLLCLSKLYRCIEKQVFEGIAHEALAECVGSLYFASSAITTKKSSMDAQLFLIKHLLILREQIAAFDVEFAVTEVSLDWTKTRAAAFGLLRKKSRFFSLSSNNAFMEFFLEGAPEVLEKLLDSKKEVDMQLKKVCEKFISESSSSLVEPVKTLLSRFDVILQLASKDGQDASALLHRQPFAAADDVHKVVTEGSKLLRKQVPAIRRALSLYLANEETEHILYRPIRTGVLQTYEALEKIVSHYYSTEDQYIMSCPSQEQVSLLLALQGTQ